MHSYNYIVKDIDNAMADERANISICDHYYCYDYYIDQNNTNDNNNANVYGYMCTWSIHFHDNHIIA